MADQYQDLLGSSRPIRREPQGSSWIGFSISAFQVLFVVAVCYFVGSKAWKSFAEWQEKSYKLCALFSLSTPHVYDRLTISPARRGGNMGFQMMITDHSLWHTPLSRNRRRGRHQTMVTGL